jgi:esterase/lipase superfamily enzyme
LFIGDDRLILQQIQALEKDEFWRAAAAQLKASGAADRNDAVIFVHGYNVSFEEAALRTAQIGFDLSIQGLMAFFSWPSRGKVGQYKADEATVEASEQDVAHFIADVASRSGARRVHVIAHSMGSRAVIRAIDILAREPSKKKLLGQLILAAPDVDAAVFTQRAGCFGKVATRATLYVSSRDLPMRVSKSMHSYPRAGFAPPVLVVPGVDTVNVTNIDVTALGHGYIAEARDVLRDMYDLIDRAVPPQDRLWLREVANAEGRHWELRA